jgi:hypothetical protein
MRGAGGRLFVALALLGAGTLGRLLAPTPPPTATPTAPIAEPTLPDGRPLSGRLAIETPPNELPSLRAELPWSVPESFYGWGSVRLFGRPRENELTVNAIVDAPRPTGRWSSACEVAVTVDGAPVAIRASYVGAPMHGGVYDAVRMELPIEAVRAMASAREVRGTICGDSFALLPAQRETLADFVRSFDALARPDRVPHETPAQMGPQEPDLPGEDDEITEDQG